MIRKIIETVFRSFSMYILLVILGRIIGRKLISRITFYDFIVGVTIGSVAVRIALGAQESPILAVISLIVISILVVITDYLSTKSFKFRILLDGEPVIVISNGKILDYNLKKMKIPLDQLIMQLREKNIFNIDDVEFAIIESDGELTVLPKTNKQLITVEDLNIQRKYTGLTNDIIIDGKIMYNNLKAANHDELWVKEQLEYYNIYDIKEVFYAGLNSAGVLYISTKTK
ncbi:MAG: DUF421 domain-containing protein [Clostridium sp.]|uniref:DUF421 domain-containing protein n=1 Tax=Clostridium sp. TaxID=1506 RepID=UPI0025BF8EFD|nr:DUF421 domain-containing protein [Clostridium sp.]MCH3963539.1 DUF421 domain-containing protein [Clostridium sp.]MCI1714680.1 DUF421 domain-containing protein [Clostridium sp.]MCI1799131.1 DUF421 domain-containing protein [Clostridium sp.]MCI1812863.1 DUF421 domain-containing protein [Clostridium sp.]MCI1869753.1 DUF421 domain-containing protein [Clostridium sp.]